MLSDNNCIIQAKLDKTSRVFLQTQSRAMSMSIAEFSGAIIRKFIYEFSQGSDAYKQLSNFVVKNENKKY